MCGWVGSGALAVVLAVVVALPSALAVTATTSAGTSGSSPDFPDSGPVSCTSPHLCYTGTQTVSGTVIVANGDATVRSGAHLTLRDAGVVFRGAGAHRLLVESGASLDLGATALSVDQASFNLQVDGTLTALGSSTDQVQGRLTVGPTGVVQLTGGAVRAQTIAVAAGGSLSLDGTVVATPGPASELEGEVAIAGANWTSANALLASGRFAARSWRLAGGASLSCDGGELSLTDVLLATAPTVSLLASSCKVASLRLTATGPIAGSGGSFTADTLDLASTTTGLSWTGGALKLAASKVKGATALTLRGGASLQAVDTSLASPTGAALACDASTLDIQGGGWTAATKAATLTACGGSLARLAIAAPQGALSWSVLDGQGQAGGRTLALDHVGFTTTATTGAVSLFALDGPGTATAVASTGRPGAILVDWTHGDGATTLTGATLAQGACLARLQSGTYTVKDLLAPATLDAGLCVKSATVAATNATLRALRPLAVETGTVTFDDSFLDPTAITADAQSGVVARRGFQAQAAYRNGDGAPGADLRVATLDGAVLQQATAGSDGRAPPLPLEVFRLASGTLAQGADLLVRGVLGNLQNETRVARGAALPRTILWDATPPSALTGLRRTSADNVAQVALAWEAATDDHLPPRYAVEVASLAGHPAQPVKLAQTATTTSATVALPAQGLYRVNVTAVDRSGNRGATQGLLVAWDTEAPTLAPTLGGTQGKGGWYGTDVTITPNASDAVTGIASTAVREGGANVPAQTLGNEGVHAITVAATDFAGNTATAALTVRIDRTAPVPPALALAHAATRQSGLVQADLLGNATDNLSGVVELRVLRMANGTATVLERLLPPFASQVNLQPVDGDNALLLEAEDGAGNTARSATVHLSVDLAGPKPLGPLPSKATDGRIQLAFEDPSGVASLEAYDGTRLLASSRSGNLEVPVSGVDRVTVVAVDGLGNEARYDVSLAGAAAAPAVGPLAALLLLGLAAIWGRRESL